MNWRTDIPTADVIVAKLKDYPKYEILNLDSDGDYIDSDYVVWKLNEIEKWADLEEDETVTDCNEIEKELERFYLDVLCADSIIPQKATEIPNSIRYHNFPIMWEDLIDIARHFAKWGAEHLKK